MIGNHGFRTRGITMKRILVALLMVCLWAAAASGENVPVTTDPPPVTKVVLYKHGMGYLEREGKIKDNASLSLAFRAEQMKDLLTSFFAVDLGGGRTVLLTSISLPKEGQSEPYHLRPMLPSDPPFVQPLYDRESARSLVTCPRPDWLWRHLLTGYSPVSFENRPFQIIETADGRAVGYLAPSREIEHEAQLQVWEDAFAPEVRIHRRAKSDNDEGLAVSSGGRLRTVSDVRFVDPLGAGPHPELDDLVTRTTQNGLMEQTTALIAELAPEVQDVRILTAQGKPVVHLVSKYGSLPEAAAGDGVRMLLRLALELAASTGAIALVEEPEMHMHPAAIRLAARAMLAAVDRGIQIVVSTHNLDLLDFLLDQAAPDKLDKLAVFRLALKAGELKSCRYSGAEARFSRMEIEEDLR